MRFSYVIVMVFLKLLLVYYKQKFFDLDVERLNPARQLSFILKTLGDL